MKKTILFSSLALLSTLAVAGDMFVDGTVKYGADFKNLGKTKEDNVVPVFVEATIDNKQCLIGLGASNPDGLSSYEKLNLAADGKWSKEIEDTARIQARVFSISCSNSDVIKNVKGWLYDESGNFGAKNLTAGTNVKIVFESESQKDGEQLKKALSASTQVQKNTKN